MVIKKVLELRQDSEISRGNNDMTNHEESLDLKRSGVEGHAL